MTPLTHFRYAGPLGASKSLMNRALIVQSFYPHLNILGESQSEDVRALKTALTFLANHETQELDCGAGGTTLRFLMARLSRESGRFFLTGKPRLFMRPHRGLIQALKPLGVEVLPVEGGFHVQSKGWQIPNHVIALDSEVSSQYLSALLLSCWELPKELVLHYQPQKQVSWAYLQMTISLLRQLGMDVQETEGEIRVPADQVCTAKQVQIEPDMSSAFALSACAVAQGDLQIQGFPKVSLQPDFAFVKILEELGAEIHWSPSHQTLHVKTTPTEKWQALELNLLNTPDLFPVLAVLLSRAQGVSRLSGLETLVHKESNRLENTRHLLASLGCVTEMRQKIMRIQGRKDFVQSSSLIFDPDHDHRMAMAATVAQKLGADIEIQNPEVVNKSCPEFWEILSSC